MAYVLPTAHDDESLAGDDGDVPVPVTCTPASGSVFEVGATTVSCTARDGAGNTRTRAFVLTLVDTTAGRGVRPGRS